MTTYFIEAAKSGRAKCKKCKETLPKDELRIGTKSLDERFGPDKYTSTYAHIECFVLPRKLGTITPAEFVQDHLEDETDALILSDEIKCREIIDKLGSKKTGRKSTGEDNAISKKMSKLRAVAEEEEEEKPAKKTKGENKFQEEVEAMRLYGKKTLGELKDVLRWNLGYGMTGTKDVLLMRCIDGHVNGRLARCPSCFKGTLQLVDENAGQMVKCSGYYDEDMGARIPCSYKNTTEAAARIQPWYFEEPSEQQAEEIKEITEKYKANAGGEVLDSGNVPAEIRSAVKDAKWPDTSTIEGKKDAANLMVKLCSDSIDIPDDEKKARQGIGKIIVNNPDATATDILELVVKEYGIKELKAAASANQMGALESSCACPSNAPIVQVFQELKDIYFKEGNTNAGSTYSKAVTALMGIDFEITLDNAKKLAKKGMKVEGIGKGSADKIHEFLETGKIQKLEEKRALQS